MSSAKKKTGKTSKGSKNTKNTAALRARKRKEFEREGKQQGIPRTWLVAAAIGFALLAGVGFLLNQGGGPSPADRVTVAGKQDYTQGNVEMTPVTPAVANGEVAVPLADVKKDKLVSFDYNKGGVSVPLLAMVTPSGRLFTASSMCEPCRSYKFHTEPDGTLTCNTCGTKWDLETLKGISGGCPNYPPQELKNVVRGGKIVLKESDVRAWRPRTV